MHDILGSPGRALEPAVREEMGARLGHDFSDVRVHTDARAAASARDVDAVAYTVGRHVVFDTGRFEPCTGEGRRVLTHELTHVVQQAATTPAIGGGLRISREDDRAEREADAAAKAATFSPRARAEGSPVLARQVQPAPSPSAPTAAPAPAAAPPAAAPTVATACPPTCTDPTFLALSVADRQTRFDQICPNGFPTAGNTFFGRAIPGETGTVLRRALLRAQQLAKRSICVSGCDPNAITLPGLVRTYPAHSPSMRGAVDIDATGQPYISHESRRDPANPTGPRIPEADIDRETSAVYDRMAFWWRYRTSIIPSGITSVRRPAGTLDSRRTWTNPMTGAQEQTTVGTLYDLLAEESTGMQRYFQLLNEPDAHLANEIEAFLVFNVEPDATLTRLGLPLDHSAASVQAFRRRIADDYRLLGGTAAGLVAFTGQPTPSTTPPAHVGDRPFVGRRPEQGFLTFPRDVLVALIDVGLTWGAIDFGRASGDVMHIDCRSLAGC